ncbi:hypothetical protein [Evansella clarkii]|nr:hypothetical protein [Evansella clarkii]
MADFDFFMPWAREFLVAKNNNKAKQILNNNRNGNKKMVMIKYT